MCEPNMVNLFMLLCVIGSVIFDCECVSRIGKTIHLTHKDRGMNINYFNDLRRDVRASNMKELTWDSVAAKHARRWSRRCIFDKKYKTTYDNTLYKQPYDVNARPGEIIMNAVRSWGKQRLNVTKFEWQRCTERKTCDYLQMVSAAVESAGCALTRCPNLRTRGQGPEKDMFYVACFFYSTTDNTVAPYQPGRRCTRCPSDTVCRKKLCSKTAASKSFKHFRRRKWTHSSFARKLPQKPSSNVIIRTGYPEKGRHHSRSNQIVKSKRGREKHSKGVVLVDRYLDEKGQIRIRPKSKLFQQRSRGTAYIYPPAPQRSGTRTKPVLKDKERKPERFIEVSDNNIPNRVNERVKRQTRRYYNYNDYERRRLMRQREIERRRQQLLDRRREQAREEERERLRRERQRLLRERERRAKLREQATQYRYSPARIETPMGQTDKYFLVQVHNTLRGTSMRELRWDNYLERWAKYVIRCGIEYPGPIDTFTNFGKIDKGSNVYNVIYDWGAEGEDLYQVLQYGCRTPDDRERCNHNVIVRNEILRRFACATMDCGEKMQLTCIYK